MSTSGNESVKVLGLWRSMFAMRVVIALKQKGVHYEYQEEDIPSSKSQLLLESNPVHKKVPVLLHNGKPVCESLIIVQYIDETWPSPHQPFLPSDPYDRALARFWADYVDKKVYDAFGRIFRNVEGSEVMEGGKRDLIEVFVTLDGALRDVFGGGPYFGGKHIGFVDIALAPFIPWFHTLETIGSFKIIEESKCPTIFAWTQSVLEYPSVKEALAISPPEKILESVRSLRKKFLGV